MRAKQRVLKIKRLMKARRRHSLGQMDCGRASAELGLGSMGKRRQGRKCRASLCGMSRNGRRWATLLGTLRDLYSYANDSECLDNCTAVKLFGDSSESLARCLLCPLLVPSNHRRAFFSQIAPFFPRTSIEVTENSHGNFGALRSFRAMLSIRYFFLNGPLDGSDTRSEGERRIDRKAVSALTP